MAVRATMLLVATFALTTLLGAPVAPDWALSAVRACARVLGAWTAISFASLLVIVPLFRARALANEAAGRRRRRLAWAEAAAPADLQAHA